MLQELQDHARSEGRPTPNNRRQGSVRSRHWRHRRIKGVDMTRVPQSSLEFEEGLMMLDGTPFTGIGYIERNGEVIEEAEYRNGLKWGVSKTMFPGGKPYKHSRLFAGVRHGRHREWHFSGELAEEADYELGFLVRRKKWDEDGDLIDE